METWIIFVLFYGVLKGLREPIKKRLLRDISVLSALFGYTFIGFLMSVPTASGVFSFPPHLFFFIAVKSLSVFVAWILSFIGIKKIPVSTYGIFDMSRVIFSTLLGVAFFHESLTVKGVASLLLVIGGLYFANRKKVATKEQYEYKYVWYVLLSCFFNAISGMMDKYIMSTGEITSSALQFWFMLLLSVFYLVYMLIKKEKIELKKIFTNPWTYLLSFSLIFGDRLLFIANSNPNSKVTIMTLLKQSSSVITLLCGKFIYKEKNMLRKALCILVIVAGIVLSVL